jgi:hypothetical protein
MNDLTCLCICDSPASYGCHVSDPSSGSRPSNYHTHFGQQRIPFLSLLFGYIDVTLRLADDSHTTDGYDLVGLCAVAEQSVLLPDVSRLHVFRDDDGD